MLKPRLSILSLGLVLLLLLAAVPQGRAAQDEPIELRVWDQFTAPSESEIVDEIYSAFTEQNPNVTITREAMSTDQMRQTVNTALASGTGPDIIFYDTGPGFAGVLADAGLILPLDDMAAQYGWNERFIPSAIQGASIDGQLYGLPLQVDLIGMYYNKTLLDEEELQVPTTVDELAAFCGQATEKGYEPPLAFSNNPGWQAGHQFSMTSTNMFGPDAMQQLLFEQQGSWDTPEMVSAIDAYFAKLRDAGCFSDPNALTYDDGNSLFFTGQSLLHPTGSWLIGDIEENMPDYEVGMVPFPSLEGGQGSYWVSGLGSAYYISAQSQNQEAAGQFLDYLFSTETAARWVGEAGYAVPMAVETENLEISPLFQTVLDALESANGGQIQLGYNIDVLAPPEFNDVMTNGFQAMLAGDKTAEQQAADLQAAWEQGMPAMTGTPAS